MLMCKRWNSLERRGAKPYKKNNDVKTDEKVDIQHISALTSVFKAIPTSYHAGMTCFQPAGTHYHDIFQDMCSYDTGKSSDITDHVIDEVITTCTDKKTESCLRENSLAPMQMKTESQASLVGEDSTLSQVTDSQLITLEQTKALTVIKFVESQDDNTQPKNSTIEVMIPKAISLFEEDEEVHM
jgi:hypothetical protein